MVKLCGHASHLPSSLQRRFELSAHGAPEQCAHKDVCSAHQVQGSCAGEEHGNDLHA